MKKATSYKNLKVLFGGLVGALQSTRTDVQEGFDARPVLPGCAMEKGTDSFRGIILQLRDGLIQLAPTVFVSYSVLIESFEVRYHFLQLVRMLSEIANNCHWI